MPEILFEKNKNSFIAKQQIQKLFGEFSGKIVDKIDDKVDYINYKTLMYLKNVNNENLMIDSLENFYNSNRNYRTLQSERKKLNSLLLPYEIIHKMKIYKYYLNLPFELVNLIGSFGDRIDEIALFFIQKNYKDSIRDIKEQEKENFYITNNIQDLLFDLYNMYEDY
jgi:hypothetical protein